MFTEAILAVLEWIYDLIAGVTTNSSGLTASFRGFNGQLYSWSLSALNNVMMPVAATILGVFALMELISISQRMDSTGATGTMPTQIVMGALLRFALARIALDYIPVIMESIYEISVYLTNGLNSLMASSGGVIFNADAMKDTIEELGFGMQLLNLIVSFVVFLVTWVATVLAEIIVTARFIELYVFFAVSPIPAATLMSKDHSHTGKSFLKSFAAVCIQGTLIFLVLTFFPVLMNSAITETANDALGILTGALCYSLVLVIAVFSTGKWSKSIMGAA